METKLREKILYAFGDVGNNFIWTFTSLFLILYYTDSVRVSAAFVGSMMLLARVSDGASDLLMGMVIEKTATRFGKARPWVLFGSIPFAASLILTFNVPSDMGNRNAYIFITYMFMTVVCYTVVNLSYHAMLARITVNQNERAVISMYRVILTSLVAIGISFTTPVLLESFGGTDSQGSWSTVSLIYAGLALIFLLICFFNVKEKVPVAQTDSAVIKKTPIGETFRILLKMKYFYLLIFMNIVMTVFNGSIGGYIYYARDVLHDAGLFGVLTACTILPIIAVAPFMPALLRRIGKRESILLGMAVCIASGIMQSFMPYSPTVAIVTMILRSVGLVPLMTASATFPGDIVDYMQWKTAIRAEGIISSVTSFGTKMGSGLGSAMLGWFLAAGGYEGERETQPASVLTAEIAVVVWVPLVLCSLCFLIMWFWNIDQYRPQIDEFLSKNVVSKDVE
jgi:GPH family glycoside/pentoside/hexuronide:cation symporter